LADRLHNLNIKLYFVLLLKVYGNVKECQTNKKNEKYEKEFYKIRDWLLFNSENKVIILKLNHCVVQLSDPSSSPRPQTFPFPRVATASTPFN